MNYRSILLRSKSKSGDFAENNKTQNNCFERLKYQLTGSLNKIVEIVMVDATVKVFT